MALPSTCVIECQTGGSDSLNGGLFDPSNANMATDLTATSANTASPVVSSASYSFVAGDVGHWLFLKSGTSWMSGWYKITSVASNKATLNAAVGAALSTSYIPNTTAGCASVASPTGGAWTLDYSQQGGVRVSLTGLTTSGASATLSTTAATKAMVGNGIHITGGTNFTSGFYMISSVVTGTSVTLDRSATTASGSAGTAGIGGALASPGQAAAVATGANVVWQKSGTYSITSTSSNVSGGVVNLTNASPVIWEGYGTLRGDTGTYPTLQASGISTVTLFTIGSGNHNWMVRGLICDGAALTGVNGFDFGSARGSADLLTAKNCVTGFNAGTLFYRCLASNCSGVGFNGGMNCIACVATACQDGFNPTSAFYCIAYNNTRYGFNVVASVTYLHGCTAYNNTSDGFVQSNASWWLTLMSCLSVSNGGYGINVGAQGYVEVNCATYNNTSGVRTTLPSQSYVLGAIALSGNPFTNAAVGDFSLNSGAGALCRSAGNPGLFPGGTTTGSLDIGAVQHADPRRIRGRLGDGS